MSNSKAPISDKTPNSAAPNSANTPNLKSQLQDDPCLNKKQASDCAQIITDLESKLELETNRANRALADYQNLVRRSQEDRIRIAALAGEDFVSVLLEPLDNLRLAATNLNDSGLNIIIDQFDKALTSRGLTLVAAEPGTEFDVETMEAVEKQGEGNQVKAIVTQGYLLNGQVIRHAKVIVG